MRVESPRYSGNNMLWNLASLALHLCCLTATLQMAAGNVERDLLCNEGGWSRSTNHSLRCRPSSIAFPLYFREGFKLDKPQSVRQSGERCSIEESDCLINIRPSWQGCLNGPECNVSLSTNYNQPCNDSFLQSSNYSVVDYACVNESRRFKGMDGFSRKAHDVIWNYSPVENSTITCSVASESSPCSATLAMYPAFLHRRVLYSGPASCSVVRTGEKANVTCDDNARETLNLTTPFDVTLNIRESRTWTKEPAYMPRYSDMYIGSSCELQIDCSLRNLTPSPPPPPPVSNITEATKSIDTTSSMTTTEKTTSSDSSMVTTVTANTAPTYSVTPENKEASTALTTPKEDIEVGTTARVEGDANSKVTKLVTILIVTGGLLVVFVVTAGICFFRHRSKISARLRQDHLALQSRSDLAIVSLGTEGDYENISSADPGATNSGYQPLSDSTRVPPGTQADYRALNKGPDGSRSASTPQPRTDSSGYLIFVPPGSTPPYNTSGEAASNYVNAGYDGQSADTSRPGLNNSGYLTPVHTGSPQSCKGTSSYVNAGHDGGSADTSRPGAKNSGYLTPVHDGSPQSCKGASSYVNVGHDGGSADTSRPGASNSSCLTSVRTGSATQNPTSCKSTSGYVNK